MYNLEELVGGRHALIAATFADAKIASTKLLNTATVAKTAATIAEQRIAAHFADVLKDKLTDALENHTLLNGEFDTVEPSSKDDWIESLNDAVENVLEDYQAVVSQSWLGMATDSPLDNEAAIINLSLSFGREAFKTLLYDPETKKVKSTNKILSAVGIVERDLTEAMAARRNGGSNDMAGNDIGAAIAVIADTISLSGGVDGWPDLESELDLASDDDDILAGSALERLGADLTHAPVLRAMRKRWDQIAPGKGVEQMMRLLRAHESGEPLSVEPPEQAAPTPGLVPAFNPATGEFTEGVPLAPLSTAAGAVNVVYVPTVDDRNTAEMMGLTIEDYVARYVTAPVAEAEPVVPPGSPPLVTPAPAASGKKPGRPPRDAAVVAGAQPINEAMALFSDNAKVKDDDVASALGISRASYNNMRNGKTPAVLTDAERDLLTKMIREKHDALAQALALMEGGE